MLLTTTYCHNTTVCMMQFCAYIVDILQFFLLKRVH